MPVYVDDMFRPYHGMSMCHMIADTSDELHEMANRIGLKAKWLQKAGTPSEHYDVCKQMRTRAIKLGAQEITTRELAYIIYQRRQEKRLVT